MKVHFIRYADDFLVTTPTKEIAEEARDSIQEFFAGRGLELSKEKTVITHIDDGFDFLGFNFRKYNGKLLIKPSRKSIESITDKIRRTVKKARAWTQDALIQTLNPITQGWANYHRSYADLPLLSLKRIFWIAHILPDRRPYNFPFGLIDCNIVLLLNRL